MGRQRLNTVLVLFEEKRVARAAKPLFSCRSQVCFFTKIGCNLFAMTKVQIDATNSKIDTLKFGPSCRTQGSRPRKALGWGRETLKVPS